MIDKSVDPVHIYQQTFGIGSRMKKNNSNFSFHLGKYLNSCSNLSFFNNFGFSSQPKHNKCQIKDQSFCFIAFFKAVLLCMTSFCLMPTAWAEKPSVSMAVLYTGIFKAQQQELEIDLPNAQFVFTESKEKTSRISIEFFDSGGGTKLAMGQRLNFEEVKKELQVNQELKRMHIQWPQKTNEALTDAQKQVQFIIKVQSAGGRFKIKNTDSQISLQSSSANIEVFSETLNLQIEKSKAKLRAFAFRADLSMLDSQTDILLEAQSGNMKCSNSTGNMIIKNFKGPITSESCGGKLELWAGQANLKVSKGSGQLSIVNHKANVNIDNFMGALNIKNHSGNFQVQMSPKQLIQGESMAGSLRIALGGKGAFLNLSTKEGDYNVPAGLKEESLDDLKIIEGRVAGVEAGQIKLKGEKPKIQIY